MCTAAVSNLLSSHWRSFVAACIGVMVAAACVTSARADAVPPTPYFLPSGQGDFRISSGRSFAERRFVEVVRQRYDFSCGSAALATLLTYNYELPVDEMGILSAMYEVGDKEKIHKEGFSLLDMKKYLESLGLRAEGYRESLDKLAKAGIPAIVLINRNGYTHFVVVKGVTRNKVLVGDPAQGLRVYRRSEFESMWNKILFVMIDMKPIAKQYFNSRALWAKKGTGVSPDTAYLANDGISRPALETSYSPNFY